MVYIVCERAWRESRAATAETGRHRNVLRAAGTERDREALHRRAKPSLPEFLTRPHIERSEPTVEVADKGESAGR